MQRLYVYTGAFVIIGVSVVVESVLALKNGGSGIILWFIVVSGGGMVVGAVYEAMTTDPDSYTINTYALFGLVFAALLSLASIVIRLF